MKLPTEKTDIETDPAKFTYFFYTPPGLGKTTFASGLPDVMFVDTERGTKHLSVFKVDVDTWEDFRTIVLELMKGDHHFQTIIIDTVGRLIEMCIRYCMKTMGIQHPSEAGWGAGWDKCKKEWDNTITKLIYSPYGLWFLGHSTTRTITMDGGAKKEDYIEPDMPNFIGKLVIPICDFIFYGQMLNIQKKDEKGKVLSSNNQRVIRTQTNPSFRAKQRSGVSKPIPDKIIMDPTEPTCKTFLEVFGNYLRQQRELNA